MDPEQTTGAVCPARSGDAEMVNTLHKAGSKVDEKDKVSIL